MPFKREEVSQLLARIHRRCCICHGFCGVKMETDHILPTAEGGEDSIDNAIPVCFDCHAEIHSYNNKHARGRKYLPAELKLHKEKWLEICDFHPELFVTARQKADVGPLHALIDELEFNFEVSKFYTTTKKLGALFADHQFRRAISEGAVAMLENGLKVSLNSAYAAISSANQLTLARINQDTQGTAMGIGDKEAREAVDRAGPAIQTALRELVSFLRPESDDGASR